MESSLWLSIQKDLLRALELLKTLLLGLITPPEPPIMPPNPPQEPVAIVLPVLDTTPAERMAEEAIKWLGKEPTPTDKIPDEVACVSSLVVVAQPVYPFDLKLSYTPTLFNVLKGNKYFKATLTPKKGCIIISPTIGENRGHTGIFIDDTHIASNSSKTGLWTDSHDFNQWVDYYKVKKGLRVYLFEPISVV